MESKFKKRLKLAREDRKLSQAKLADMAKVPASSISHFERGSRLPSYYTIISLAQCLKVTADYLLGLDNVRDETRFTKQEFLKMIEEL